MKIVNKTIMSPVRKIAFEYVWNNVKIDVRNVIIMMVIHEVTPLVWANCRNMVLDYPFIDLRL